MKSDIMSMQAKREKYKELEQKYKDLFQHNKKQAVVTEKQIRANMETLHQFLREEEETRLCALKAEEEQKANLLRQSIEDMDNEVASLTNTIRIAEQELRSQDVPFLLVNITDIITICLKELICN